MYASIKLVRRKEMPTKKAMKLNECVKFTKNNSKTYEKGGYIKIKNKNMKFMNIAQAYKNENKGIEAIDIGDYINIANKRKDIYVWHLHPNAKGWWPSYNDLYYSLDIPSVLVTKKCIWLYNTSPFKFNNYKIKECANKLHISLKKFASNEKNKNWKQKATNIILQFIQECYKNGVEIYCLWLDEYNSNKHIENEIIKYIKSKQPFQL